MSIKSLFKGKNSPSLDSDKYTVIQNDTGPVESIGSQNRIKKFVVKGLGYTIFGAASVVFAGAAGSVINGAFQHQGIYDDNRSAFMQSNDEWLQHEDIMSHLGAESLEMNERYRNGNVVMVHQDDPNLKYLLANVDKDFRPDYSFHSRIQKMDWVDWFNAQSLHNYTLVSSPIDFDRNFNAEWSHKIMTNPDQGAHMMSKIQNGEEEDLKVAWSNSTQESLKFKAIYKSPVSMRQSEMDTFVRFHEEAHGQDMDYSKLIMNPESDKPYIPSKTLQKEVLADIYGSLKVASITGNYDFVKGVALPFRYADPSDTEHQTSLFLQGLLNSGLDPKSLKGMDDAALWQMTESIYKKYDAVEMLKKTNVLSHTGRLFASHHVDISNIEKSRKVIAKVDSRPESEILAEYGKNISSYYLDHLTYAGKKDDLDSQKAFISLLRQTAGHMGNDYAESSIEAIEKSIEDKGAIKPEYIDKAAALIGVKASLDYNIAVHNNALLQNAENERKGRVAEIQEQLDNGTYEIKSYSVGGRPEAVQKFLEKIGKVEVENEGSGIEL